MIVVIGAGPFYWTLDLLTFCCGLLCSDTLLFFSIPALLVYSALSAFVFLLLFLGMGQTGAAVLFTDPSIYRFTYLVPV